MLCYTSDIKTVGHNTFYQYRRTKMTTAHDIALDSATQPMDHILL